MAITCDEIDWAGVASAMRERRSVSGLSHDDAARTLCLSKKQILALEGGSGAPFPGALVRSWCGRRYAVLLGLDWERLAQPAVAEQLAVTVESLPAPATGRGQPRVRLLLGAVALMLVAVAAAKLAVTDSSASMPAARSAPKADSAVLVSYSTNILPIRPAAAPVNSPAAAADKRVDIADPAPTPAANAVTETVFEVQGKDPTKLAGSFFVSSKEPAALVKKKWDDPGEGVRIDLAPGAGLRIPIAPNEIVRVAEGRNLEIFYQGSGVPPQVVNSGAWVTFVRKSADISG